ncbi:NAD(P)/FAD-dependent oxidoreductase [Jiella sp. M17.18]|uniref:NAD(P)/FAD-dependent oxidoreductase n=1 Tax=Jiella sp. M17.18 TaxID=3234247 RepID=UPI0034E01A3C
MVEAAAARPDAGAAHDVLVVGAGIVGLACALKLQQAGRSVTLVDRRGIARETSSGNAAGLAFSDIIPMASRGMMRKVPGWLADPLGPLAIPPAYFPRILPWLVRYWRAGWPDRIEASIAAQAAMMRLSQAEMNRMVDACGIAHMVHSKGSLELYESEAEFAASLPGWQRRTDHDIAFEHVRGERLADLQPGLSPRFVAGTFVPSWQSVSDPFEFAVAIGSHALGAGATLIEASVIDIASAGEGVSIRLDDGRVLACRQAVLAAGAWSKQLARKLGDAIPLETERGYNTTLPPGAFDVRQQLIFGGHGFVVSALSTGIRVGGAVELGGLDLAPNFRRADAMLTKAAQFLPGLKTQGGRQWMGFRPSLPDSLAVIGRSRATPNVVYAFGHGHLGLTQSAGTGKLVSDLVCGEEPQLDLAPFSPQRF